MLAGEKALAQTENPSRERILGQIRAGLRTVLPELAAIGSDREIFEPVIFEPIMFEPINDPLERFQKE